MKSDKTVETVYSQYYKTVFRFCMKLTNGNLHDAEDMTGEVFHVFFAKQDALNFEAEAAIITWLYRTAKNKWYRLVKQAKRNAAELDNTDLFSRQFDDEEEEKLYDTYLAQIKNILSGTERELFCAIVEEKQTYKAISEKTGVSETALRVRWYRLKSRIRPYVDTIIYNR
ncbi:MAG: sigma-70 family RNA polymerase sigma factor [Clostridia bacterium]|nr:sigma-70 family RNA polymerase sigma factor [Clostridia bacterium]